MADKVWKARERQVAEFLKSERTPLSGGNSKQTRADTLSEWLFDEHKHRKRHAVYELWKETKELAKREGKLPMVTLSQHGERGFLCVIHADDFLEIARKLGEVYAESEQV